MYFWSFLSRCDSLTQLQQNPSRQLWFFLMKLISIYPLFLTREATLYNHLLVRLAHPWLSYTHFLYTYLSFSSTAHISLRANHFYPDSSPAPPSGYV